jgi:hypothetical protein
MNQIPNCNRQELQKLDEKILSTNQKANKVEKSKKDIFKRLTSQVGDSANLTLLQVIVSDGIVSRFYELQCST